MTRDEILNRIEDQTAELNKIADDAARTVKEIEDRLAKEGAGIPAFIEHDGIQYCYVRYGDKFRICISEDKEHESIKPFSDHKRMVKIKAIAGVDFLLMSILKELESVGKESKR